MKKYLTTFLLLPFSFFLYSQGCSDAGFCTVNSFQPAGSDGPDEYNNQLKVGGSYGLADYDIAVAGFYLEYSRQITSAIGLDARITTLSQTGNDVSVFDIADFYINVNYNFTEKFRMTLGVKVPQTNGNTKEDDGLPLPMDYQSSLGTLDLIGGIGYAMANFHIVVAAQVPLTQNENAFVATDYPESSKLRDFQTTNKFVRSPDILLRVSYPIALGSRFQLTPSLLPIYHLGNDKYTDDQGTQQEIDGSEGLTLNGNIYIDYKITEKQGLQLSLGSPFVVREVRPDGLTRAVVAGLEYRMSF
jgi:hypothetical protein